MNKKNRIAIIFVSWITLILQISAPLASADETTTTDETGTFDQAVGSIDQELRKSLDELAALRERIAEEKLPLTRKLREIESELKLQRDEYARVSRDLTTRTIDLSTLTNDVNAREEEAIYLSNLFGEYIRNFEARVHVAERQRFEGDVRRALEAPDDASLDDDAIAGLQLHVVSLAIDRLEETLGGARFEGRAVDGDGEIKQGTFVVIGPAAYFRSNDGDLIGTVEERLNSADPGITVFKTPENTNQAEQILTSSMGIMPFDPTLGSAHLIESTSETFLEHVEKGGVVMIPIFAMAGAALLVALFKWLSFLFIRRPSKRALKDLLKATANNEKEVAHQAARSIGGPTGKMLTAGVEHMHEPRELIEEVMYETVLATRLRLQRFLPFVAICAAAAPLLGLLGTVTGIINTFKLITVFGTGDVKTLSGGISEALITTEFGLIVAIPSLLIHAFLARRARGVIDQMEKAGVAYVNEIGRAAYSDHSGSRISMDERLGAASPAAAANGKQTDGPVREVLIELLSGAVDRSLHRKEPQPNQDNGAESELDEVVATQ